MNPLVALHFQPIESLALRASWGTGFIPPEINQLTAPRQSIANGSLYRSATRLHRLARALDADRRRQSQSAAGIFHQLVGRLDLDTTRARRTAPVTRLHRIEKEDNIATLSEQQIIDNEAYFRPRDARAELAHRSGGLGGPDHRHRFTTDQFGVGQARSASICK